MTLIPCEYSTLLKIPEQVREVMLNSGIVGVNDPFLPLYNTKPFRWQLWGGRGSGKSHHAMDYADYLLSTLPYCRVLFLRFIKDDVRDSLWQGFLDNIISRGRESEYNLRDHNMRATHVKTGNEIASKGVKASKTQTAKLKSIAGFTHVFIEEADEIPKEDKRKLIDSVRKKGVEIQIIEMFNTPPKAHYIWEDYRLTPTQYEGYYMAEPLPDSGISAIWTTWENNTHNLNDAFIKRYENAKNSKDQDYYLTDVCGLIPSGNRGLIHKGWQRCSVDDFIRFGGKSYYYIDWGTRDECAMGWVKLDKRIMAIKGLSYKPMGLLDVAITLCQLGFTEKEIIICDSAKSTWVTTLRTGFDKSELSDELIRKYPQLLRGFTAVGVRKPAGSVREGIDMVNEYDEVYVCDDNESENIWTEYTDYRWELDKNGNPTDNPVDGHDHHMNGVRYVAYSRNILLSS